MRRTVPAAVVCAIAVLVLAGCAKDTTVAANVALQFPGEGFLWLSIGGPLLLAVLAVVVGVLDAIVLATTLRAVRAQRVVRRRPIVVALVGTLVLIAAAVVFAVVLVLADAMVPLIYFG